MKRFALLTLCFLLSACAAPTANTPVPTQTSEVPKTSDVLPTAAITLTPEPLALTEPADEVEINQLTPETMGCYKADMCMGLDVKDGAAMYTELLGAFVGSYENKDWMGGIKTAEEFRTFLKTSMHADPTTGKMRAYWVPLERNGAKFMLLQGNGAPAGGIFSAKNPAIVKAGGFYLDDVAFVAASKAEIDANKGGIADWLTKMWEQNGKKVLITMSSIPVEQSGMTVVDGQVFFVTLNNGVAPDNFDAKDELLGQSDPAKNGAIVSALLDLYLKITSGFANDSTGKFIGNSKTEPNPDKWIMPALCVADNSGFCEGKNPTRFMGDEALFVPAE